jgi:hypothetical protein
MSGTILGREPVLFQTLVMAIINLGIVFGVVNLDDAQIGGINLALAAILGFIVRKAVTPLAEPKNNQGQPLVPAASQPPQPPPPPDKP